jgi:hypothetical protein
MTKAADIYAAHADALAAQNSRIYGPPVPGDIWSGPTAAQFRFDPHRQLDANLAVMPSYVEPDDVLISTSAAVWPSFPFFVVKVPGNRER